MFDYTNPTAKEIKEMIANGKRPMVFYHISKEEVEEKDYRGIGKLLKTLTTVGKGAKKSLVITCNGYDDVTDELWEIKEVNQFVRGMFDKYPYLFYYIADFDKEIGYWLLCCLADEIFSVFKGERMTGNEIMAKYGLNNDNIPRVHAHITFKAQSENENRFLNMLRAIMKHGKLNKDANGGKRIAIEYAFSFDNTEDTLRRLGITDEEVRELWRG